MTGVLWKEGTKWYVKNQVNRSKRHIVQECTKCGRRRKLHKVSNKEKKLYKDEVLEGELKDTTAYWEYTEPTKCKNHNWKEINKQ